MLGIQQGKTLGLTEGVRQKALETAKVMLTMGYPLADICNIFNRSRGLTLLAGKFKDKALLQLFDKLFLRGKADPLPIAVIQI